MRQAKCGCRFTGPKPSWKPWKYKRGQWNSWKPVSFGGDEWCRWTLVVGFGYITGVWVIPIRSCRGKESFWGWWGEPCEACGPEWVDRDHTVYPNWHKA